MTSSYNTGAELDSALGKLSSDRRQTVDAIVNVFHRLAAEGYENLATPNRPSYQVALSN